LTHGTFFLRCCVIPLCKPPQANYEDLEWGANEEEIYHVKSFFKKTYDALVNKKPRAERTLLASKLAKTFFNLKKLERIF